ncbi:sensor histidine kinase [Diaminobutyricibacter sp. McL0608]|uniref:sensor histidine kinase n=1 Tax=Leifsonia sp. McL0608 TaxID=3143537 RepID=UPI0031F2DD4D
MSLGLPSHLARAANSRAIAAAAQAAAFVCLASAFVNLLIAALGSAGGHYWYASIVLAPMAALLILLSRRRTTALTIAYLAVGTASTYLYAASVLALTPSYHDTNLFVIALPIVAMTLVGGTGTGALAGILWATVGFALAEAAVYCAALTAGRAFHTDAISLGAYLLIVGVLAFDGLTRGVRSRPQSAVHRAIRDNREAAVRQELAVEAAAELHDTVLSELVTIASSMPGPLRPQLRRRIEDDLRQLGRDPTASVHERRVASTDPAEAWYESDLREAIELARDEGLSVDVSGDRESLGLLSTERRKAVGLAVRQCLISVLRHAGSATAEIAISASDSSVSVLVVDAGRGFTATAATSDRLGLRNSVHDRIERVGGTVTIWSNPDIGTTVMMRVPASQGAEKGLVS